MIDVCELLNLKRVDVENLSDSYSGYARVLEVESPTNYSLIGSCWIIAAVYQSIISPQKAKEYFLEASKAYKNIDSALYDISLICGENFGGPIKETFVLPGETKFFRYLRLILNGGQNIFLDLRSNNSGLIESINIPYTLVNKALEEIIRNKTIPPFEPLFPITSDLITRFGEIIDNSMTDDRWKNLEGNILPYEPSIMAIMVVIFELMKEKKMLNIFIDNYKGYSRASKPLILIAREIISNEDPNS